MLRELSATDVRLANFLKQNLTIDQCQIDNIVKHVNGPPSAISFYRVFRSHLINDVNASFCFIISFFFGFSRLGVVTAENLHFYGMAFVLRSDALPATNPLFGGKTGSPVFYIKVRASR